MTGNCSRWLNSHGELLEGSWAHARRSARVRVTSCRIRSEVDDLGVAGELGRQLRPTPNEPSQHVARVGLAVEVVDGHPLAFEASRHTGPDHQPVVPDGGVLGVSHPVQVVPGPEPRAHDVAGLHAGNQAVAADPRGVLDLFGIGTYGLEVDMLAHRGNDVHAYGAAYSAAKLRMHELVVTTRQLYINADVLDRGVPQNVDGAGRVMIEADRADDDQILDVAAGRSVTTIAPGTTRRANRPGRGARSRRSAAQRRGDVGYRGNYPDLSRPAVTRRFRRGRRCAGAARPPAPRC